MWAVEERAGLSEGYYSKVVHPDGPEGRIASWEVLQRIVAAIFDKGPKVVFKAHDDEAMLAVASKPIHNASLKTYFRGQLIRISMLGGARRAQVLSPRQRQAIAWKAARTRWGRRSPQDSQD